MTTVRYTIEQMAERLKITPRTLHYYEEVGLINPVCRTEGGHRLYDDQVVQLLEHILRLKHHLGASLQEIRAILDAEKTLERLRESYYKEGTSVLEKNMILDQSILLLRDQVSLIDDKMEKLHWMKQNFLSRLTKAEELLKDNQDENEPYAGINQPPIA